MKGARYKALIVTSTFPRWVGDSTPSFVLQLALGLQQFGWEADVLAPHAPGAAVDEVLDGVRVHRFRYAWPVGTQTLCYDGGIMPTLKSRPSEWLKVPSLTAAETAALWRHTARNTYDLVNAHWILPQGFAAALVRRLRRLPLVVTVHGSDVFELQRRPLRWLKRFSLGSSDAITVNSATTRAAVEEFALPGAMIETIPIGLSDHGGPNTKRVEEIRALHRRTNGPLVAFVGRLVPQKGAASVVEAVHLLEADHPDATALIVGDGPERTSLGNQARRLGVQERVFFTGWVEPTAVPSFMAAADVVVVPSQQPEGLGLVALEAMAAGTPVVASSAGGLRELGAEGAAMLIDVPEAQSIRDAVVEIHASETVRASLVAAGKSSVRHHGRSTTAPRMADLFDRLLSSSGRKG